MTETVAARPQDAEVGERLKQLRRDRRLSQAELGGGRFSGSYVSHVEKGRRRLSGEMVEFFAERLGVSRERLSDGEPTADLIGDADRVMAVQEVQRALDQHQFARAARMAEKAVSEASARGHSADVWSLSLMRAQAWFEDDQFQQAMDLARALATHPLAQRLPHLGVEALLIATRAARHGGDLIQSRQNAEQAVLLTAEVESADLRVDAYIVLVGSLMETDELDRAVVVSGRLVEMLDLPMSDHIRGLAQWAVGNVLCLTGRLEDGLARHAEAVGLLHPQVDLRAWGRFRKASATVRLQNHLTEGVLELLHQAGDALRIVGNPSDLTELRLAEARLWLLEDQLDRARAMVEYSLQDQSLAHAAHSRADAEGLLGEIELAADRPREAAAAFLRAATKFEYAGAYRRSVEMWRRHAAAVG